MGVYWRMVGCLTISSLSTIVIMYIRVIDKPHNSSDGWFYGEDFNSLSIDKISQKPSYFVRRRKWIRFVREVSKPVKVSPNLSSSRMSSIQETKSYNTSRIERDTDDGYNRDESDNISRFYGSVSDTDELESTTSHDDTAPIPKKISKIFHRWSYRIPSSHH
jgi:hypothetical protein